MLYADVILPVATNGYTYSVPESMLEALSVGMRVEVPLGARAVVGVVERIHQTNPSTVKLRDIRAIIDRQDALIDPLEVRLWRWMADYYMTPVGEVYRSLVPLFFRDNSAQPRQVVGISLADGVLAEEQTEWQATLARSKAQLTVMERFVAYLAEQKAGAEPVDKREFIAACGASSPAISKLIERGLLREVMMLPEQPICSGAGFISDVCRAHLSTNPIAELLHQKNVVLYHQRGLDSAKEQLYAELIARQTAQACGGVALILSPDNLSAGRTFDRLSELLPHGCRLAALTGRTTMAARRDLFFDVAAGRVDVVVGTRSALYLPFRYDRLQLVVVEQEENFAYKSAESAPRYHARDMAVVLGSLSGAKVLLCSETPSLESYTMARGGRWGYWRPAPRGVTDMSIGGGSASIIPMGGDIAHRDDVHVAQQTIVPTDDRAKSARPQFMVLDRGKGLLSSYLLRRIEQETSQGRQVIIFQNRRGFAQHTECEACFYVPQCPNCSVSLIYHKSREAMMCHYCGYSEPTVTRCPACGSDAMRQSGIGTQRLEEALTEHFPALRVARLDFDNTRRRGAFQEIAYDFSTNRSDIMVGTKLMINGLDFSNVSLVGIVNADNMFTSSDFRSSERAFALLTQLAHRVDPVQGEVIIQTSRQTHPVIQWVKADAAEQFYEHELEQRARLNYPPAVRMMTVVLSSTDYVALSAAAVRCDQLLRPTFGARLSPFFEPPVARVAGRYALHQTLRIERHRSSTRAKEILAAALASLGQQFRTVRVYVDIDPI